MKPKLMFPILVALIGATSVAANPMALVTTAVSVITKINSLVSGMDGLITHIKDEKTETKKFQEEVTKKLDDIQKMCTQIDDIKDKIDDLSVAVQESTDKIINSIEFNNAKRIVADFKKNVDYVNKVYHDFASVWNNMHTYENGSADDYFKGLIGDSVFDRSLSEMLSDITSSPNSQSSIFSAMSKYYDTKNGYEFRCENISPLDDLHIFYGNVIATFYRGYSVLLLSYQHLKENTDHFRFYQDRQNTVFVNLRDSIQAVTRHAKIDFNLIADTDYRMSYACDPHEWQEEHSFIRVKNYVTVQFGTYYWGDHVDNPKSVEEAIEHDCLDWAEYRAVPGAEFDSRSQVCVTPFSPELKNPYSVEYEELQHPWNRVWESRRCVRGGTNYFSGLCELDHNSDPFLSVRKLSLRLQECDTRINEIVTDATLYVQDNCIHIRLRCGVMKDFKIDPDSLRWMDNEEPLSQFDPDEYVVLGSKIRSFNIDNVVVPDGELVTGAKFKVVDEHFVALVVKGNKVIINKNEITLGEPDSYTASVPKDDRSNIDLTDLPRLPKIMNQTSQIGVPGKNYIDLTTSKYSPEYFNIAIVPYFDMNSFAVHSWDFNVVPLGGLGFFYKSLPGYAGFFALKHLSPTYVYYVDADDNSV